MKNNKQKTISDVSEKIWKGMILVILDANEANFVNDRVHQCREVNFAKLFSHSVK